jgi:2-dehydro-3-deoxyphosphogluconate aldolase/(4S)-4-hydroxy-2-oxoglutarate aldolase
MTVTEIQTAEEWGSEIIKIFPGTAAGGPDFIKSVLAPMPRTRLMPTGGVEPTESSLRAWFGAGAVCAGLGSQLIRADQIKAADWAGLTRDIAQTRELIDRIRHDLKGKKS